MMKTENGVNETTYDRKELDSTSDMHCQRRAFQSVVTDLHVKFLNRRKATCK